MEEINKLKRQRQSLRSALSRIHNFCVGENAVEEGIKVRAVRADELFNDFESIQRDIEQLTMEDKLPEEEKYRSEMENKYYSIKSIYSRLNDDANSVISGQASTSEELSTAIGALVDNQNTMGNLLQRVIENGRAEQNVRSSQDSNNRQGDLRYDNSNKVKKTYLELLIDQPRLKTATFNEMRQFYNSINESFNALKVLGEPVEQWDSVLLFILEKRLDDETATLWFREKQPISPTFLSFMEFVERRISELENTQKSEVRKRNQMRTFVTTFQACPICAEEHLLFNCNRFKELKVDQRRELVRQHNICYNCLQPNHEASECKRSSCRKCDRKHNTLLHIQTAAIDRQQLQSAKPDDSVTSCVGIHRTQQSLTYVLLPTANIMVRDRFGVPQRCRAMLDSCCQRTLISESCIQRLQIARAYDRTVVNAAGDVGSCRTRGKAEIHICAAGKVVTTDALCLSKLTKLLPCYEINDEKLKYFDKLNLADASYRKPGNIDIIIGADIYIDCCLEEIIKHPSGQPAAIKTIFGWVIIGSTSTPSDSLIISATTYVHLDRNLQRFWETEELSVRKIHLTPEEQQAKENYKKYVKRNSDGRYIVKLPLKENKADLGESKSNALKTLYAMEKKFKTNEYLRVEYVKFMNTYLDLGHMEEAIDVATTNICFLPHHAIMKPSSSTTKLRVVYDASCKTSNGLSLNDNLLVGPVIQNDIFDIITKFRMYQIGFTSDIEKMYKQTKTDKAYDFVGYSSYI